MSVIRATSTMRQWTRTASNSSMALGPAQQQSLRDSPETALTRALLETIFKLVDTEDTLWTGKRVRKWTGPAHSSISSVVMSQTAALANAFCISSL